MVITQKSEKLCYINISIDKITTLSIAYKTIYSIKYILLYYQHNSL